MSLLLTAGGGVAILRCDDIILPGLLTHELLLLFVVMQHTEAEVVPELWVALQSVRTLFKVLKGLEVLLIFEKGEAHIEDDFIGSLRVEVADVQVRRLTLRGICVVGTTFAWWSWLFTLSFAWLSKRLVDGLPKSLKRCGRCRLASTYLDALRHLKEFESFRE